MASTVAIPPGTIVHTDFRSPEARAAAAAAAASPLRPLRLCTWNIERGYKLQLIIEHLKEVDADILSLQELDIGCDRSGGADTFEDIGRQLGMDGLFLCEFEELRSPLRDARSQGGGVHGNAVFSRWGFSSWRVLEHSHHPVDWESPLHALAAKEPRKGRRATLVADAAAPGGDVRVYCTHLEVFCGILGRAWQFSDILGDVKTAEAGRAAADAAAAAPGGGGDGGGGVAPSAPAGVEAQGAGRRGGSGGGDGAKDGGADGQQQQHHRLVPVRRYAILGDLNTMANGVARLSPNYCCDRLRWRSLGMSEARYWDRHIFACAGSEPSMVNKHFLELGLPEDVCRALVNPGFFDPFDPVNDITLDNPAYGFGPLRLMTGKLDWALLKGLKALTWRMGNLDWAASDHRSLVVEAE